MAFNVASKTTSLLAILRRREPAVSKCDQYNCIVYTFFFRPFCLQLPVQRKMWQRIWIATTKRPESRGARRLEESPTRWQQLERTVTGLHARPMGSSVNWATCVAVWRITSVSQPSAITARPRHSPPSPSAHVSWATSSSQRSWKSSEWESLRFDVFSRALQTAADWSGPAVWDESGCYVLGAGGGSGALHGRCHQRQGNDAAVQLHQLRLPVLQLVLWEILQLLCDCIQRHVLQWNQQHCGNSDR